MNCLVLQGETNQRILGQKNGHKVRDSWALWSCLKKKNINLNIHVINVEFLLTIFLISIAEWFHQAGTDQWFDQTCQHHLFPEEETT